MELNTYNPNILCAHWCKGPKWPTLIVKIDNRKEIVFHRPASRHLNIAPPLPDTKRVTQATVLGIDISSTLSTSAYVNSMLLQINQLVYTSCHSSNCKAWQFRCYVIYLLVLSCPRSQLTADDRNRINAISRKAVHRGMTHTAFDIEEIIDSFDRKLFFQYYQPWSLFTPSTFF